MNWLIRLLARRAARDIEQGSVAGAAIGAMLGGLLGVAIGFVLREREVIEASLPAACVPIGLVGAFGGALFGSLVRAPGSAAPWEQAITDSTVVRVGNLNYALGQIGVCAILAALGLAMAVAYVAGTTSVREEPIILLAPVLLVGCVAAAAVPVLWVDVGLSIRVRRLFTSREYRHAGVTIWGFRVPGRIVRTPPASATIPLVFAFAGGRTVELTVPAPVAKRVGAVMARHTAAPAATTTVAEDFVVDDRDDA